jgi:3-methyladenine DNA glycosylase AlkD
MTADDFMQELAQLADPKHASVLQRFFKTGPGEYGEGDVFLGVRVPDIRRTIRRYPKLELAEIEKLLSSDIHEHRLAAVIIMSKQYPLGDRPTRGSLHRLYLKGLVSGWVNNWDIVDVSAEYVLGAHWFGAANTDRLDLATSSNLWCRRAAIMSTFYDVKRGKSDTTIEIAGILLDDEEDLIHKAVGWMLREVGKRVETSTLTQFLDDHAAHMPRTMLRYSIERLDETKRHQYMAIKKSVDK